MEQGLYAMARSLAQHLSGASGAPCTLFSVPARDFASGAPPAFCKDCTQRRRGVCDPRTTHLYGCFEAERWNGLYIYYCPMGLIFIASTVYEEEAPCLAFVGGPVVMGSAADLLSENGGLMAAEILAMPAVPPAQVTDIAQVQWSLAMYLSGRRAQEAAYTEEMKAHMLNTLYDITAEIQQQGAAYPLELERKLQAMIARGDKQGSRELINQLLGHLYFEMGGDFETIKERAAELIVLFSRASIEGGADPRQIFGLTHSVSAKIRGFRDLDELSVFLTESFHRFVGYVFDFDRVKHSDVIHKAVDYIRQNFARRLALDDVAAHVYLSKSYLSRIFKEELGASFTGFVNDVRVDKSKELLLDRTVSLADIASLVGFDDQSYFTKVFRRSVGVSPGQYRRSGGKVEALAPKRRND